MRNGRADLLQRVFVRVAKTSCRGFRTGPSSPSTSVDADRRAPRARPRARPTRTRAAGPATPRRIHTAASAESPDREHDRDEHDVEAHEPVLEFGDHRRRRVAGRALPPAALHGRDEVHDPGADRDGERDDRGRGRMLGHRRRGGGKRDREARVQQVPEHHRDELRRIDAAAVRLPEQDRDHRRDATRRPTRPAAPVPWPRRARKPASDAASRSSSAPLCRSPATRRIATNGSRNAAASSHALKVGAQTPTSGENASPTPAAVPFSPLASAYVRTALMNETPTSGPMSRHITHQARDASSSRHSLASSHRYGARRRASREGKKHLLRGRGSVGAWSRGSDRCGELVERAFAAHAARAKQHEAIADARRLADLMNREEQRPARAPRDRAAVDRRRDSGAGRAPRTAHRASRTGCGISSPIASSARFRWPLDNAPIGDVQERREVEPAQHLVARAPWRLRAAEQTRGEIESPVERSVPATARWRRGGRRAASTARARDAGTRRSRSCRHRTAARRPHTRAAWSCPIRSARSGRAPRRAAG